MADTGRASTQALTFRTELGEDPYGYEFYQVLRLLEAMSPDKPRLGESSRAGRDVIRLGQEPSLAFPPSMVSKFVPGGEGGRDRLDVLFLGLFGPNGPLPLHLTEYARQRDTQFGDETFRRFVDIFHHRLLSLFYRAWANAQPCVNLDRPDEDRFAEYVGALIGMGDPAAREHDDLHDHTRFYFSGILAMRNAPAEGLESMVEGYLGIPTRVDEFVGEWLKIPEDFRLRTGEDAATGTLGESATIGAYTWSCQSKFQLVCGPMSVEQFRRLLPDRKSLSRLRGLVRSHVGDALAWEINLVLRKEEVPAIRLGQDGYLGWTTWCGTRQSAEDADDVVLQLSEVAA